MSLEMGEGGEDIAYEVDFFLWAMGSPGQVPVKEGSGQICILDSSVEVDSRPGAGRTVLRPLPFSR